MALDSPTYEIDHPWASADLKDLQFAQQQDVLYVIHPSYKPRKITRTAHDNWTISNYAPTADVFTSTNNYPAAVTFFQERIVFGGSNNDPNKLWFSVSGDPEDLTTGSNADNGFTATISGPQNDTIRWLHGADSLVIGTTGRTWASEKGVTLTPTNRSIDPFDNGGVARLQPVAAG